MSNADELVKLALLELLHDTSGLTGSIEPVAGADWDRFEHLEVCMDAAIVGTPECEQDCTSTGTGFEVLTVHIGCLHGVPIAARTSGYGIGGLLRKMEALGQDIADDRKHGGDDDA